MILLLSSIGAVLIVFVMGSGESELPSLQNPDSSARSGCDHSIYVIKEVRKGVVDEMNLIDNVKEVYDSLGFYEVPGLAPKSQGA